MTSKCGCGNGDSLGDEKTDVRQGSAGQVGADELRADHDGRVEAESGLHRVAHEAGFSKQEASTVQNQNGYARVDDGFARLWTPHRMVYIDGESRPKTAEQGECPFCIAPRQSDEESLIVYRGEHVYAIMNLFPYNSGHMLICPYDHVSDYIDLTPDVRAEFGELTATAIRALGAASGPQGFNIGMNQGKIAGAGIAAHLHQHIVPRWFGDSNFFPLIAHTKAIPELLSDARERLAKAWPTVQSQSRTGVDTSQGRAPDASGAQRAHSNHSVDNSNSPSKRRK